MTAQNVVEPDALLKPDFTGPRSASTAGVPDVSLFSCCDDTLHSAWCQVYAVFYGAGADLAGVGYCHTAPASLEFQTEALPIRPTVGPSEALESLMMIERTFGSSASDLSKMLRVSRQMIYHYRKGMEPDLDNFRRIRLIAGFAEDIAFHAPVSLEPVLKVQQPEGKTLLAYMSEKTPDVPLVRRILLRASADLDKRRRLAALIGYATPHDRQDIMRDKHARGKPIYVSDPKLPGRIVQIRPDQSRARGRMVNRVFVPDEE